MSPTEPTRLRGAETVFVLARQVWPGALVLAAQGVFLSLTVFRPGHHAPHPVPATPSPSLSLFFNIIWYGSIVGAPGVSLLDGAIYFVCGYRAAQQARMLRAGPLGAMAASFAGSVVLFASAAIVTPGLAGALFTNPGLFLVLAAYILVPLAYAGALGALAGAFSRWKALPGALRATPGR